MIPTGFLDPAGNGFDLTDLGALAGFIVTVTVAGYGASRWANRSLADKMTAIIDRRTKPIQSGYENDGNSLTDISKQVRLVIDRQGSINTELVDLRAYGEAAHEVLAHKIDLVANRLDDHAASPLHDRRNTRREE